MKRYFYIFCFVILGLILQQIIHTVVEIWYINLLLSDYNTYGFGWSWQTWFLVHHIYSIVLIGVGIVWGYCCGEYFWPKLYDMNGKVRNPRPWRI